MIDILMATYNGEKFLSEQLDSIIAQNYTEWRLIIRDDCSQDRTVSILKRYQKKYSGKIKLISSKHPSGSAMNNFFKLLDYAKNDYIMFSDQDDVWKEDKIQTTLSKMNEMEKQFGTATPLLVHTDLSVVDENLTTINPSLFKMQDMDYKRDKLNNLLATNIVTGCTMLFNRPLLNLLTQKPKQAVMHDMWIALVAIAFGKIGFVTEPTILYRQHGKNANGVKNVNSFSYISREIEHFRNIKNSLEKRYLQAEEFLLIYKNNLNQEQVTLLKEFAKLKYKWWFDRAYVIFKYGFQKKGFIRVVGQILL